MTVKRSKYFDIAQACGRKFQIGNKVSWTAFMQWAYDEKWVNEPPIPESHHNKTSNEWQGYEHRRSKLVDSINIAAKSLESPFVIKRIKGTIYITAPHEEVINQQIPSQTFSFAKTKVERVSKCAKVVNPFSAEGQAVTLTMNSLEDMMDIMEAVKHVKTRRQAKIQRGYEEVKRKELPPPQ